MPPRCRIGQGLKWAPIGHLKKQGGEPKKFQAYIFNTVALTPDTPQRRFQVLVGRSGLVESSVGDYRALPNLSAEEIDEVKRLVDAIATQAVGLGISGEAATVVPAQAAVDANPYLPPVIRQQGIDPIGRQAVGLGEGRQGSIQIFPYLLL